MSHDDDSAKVCPACGVQFAPAEAEFACMGEDPENCYHNQPIKPPLPVSGEPMTEAQLEGWQMAIDTPGCLARLDAASGGDSYTRLARLLIAGGKCRPPPGQP